MLVYVVLMLACCANTLSAQSGLSLYTRSLTACVQARQDQGNKDDPVIVVKNLITENPEFMYSLPTNVGPIRIEYMDGEALRKRFKATRQPFQAIELRPIITRGAILMVDCQENSISVSKGTLVLWVRGGVAVRRRFDAAVGDYVLVSAQPHWPTM